MAETKKAAGWTAEETRVFELKIIAQLMNGGAVKLSELSMPGRTPKALTHAWSKLRAEISALDGGEASENGGKPVVKKPVTKAIKKSRKAGDADNGEEPAAKKPRKKAVKNIAPKFVVEGAEDELLQQDGRGEEELL